MITVFGIRHHGPGCARSLRSALERMQPDIVLVEGPPDAQHAVSLIAHPAMLPPVALLIYRPDRPQQATYFPFTAFSPEWLALRYAAEQGIPARFIDLPQAIQLAAQSDSLDTQTLPVAPHDRDFGGTNPLAADPTHTDTSPSALLRRDPFALLAQAAGYEDREIWWEQQVEQRRDAADIFQAILEVMTELRAEADAPDAIEAQREAHMRQAIRLALREGYTRIAVVCGAWHAPALAAPGPAALDAATLRGLPSVSVTATWIPWTNSRLAARSGYGAGIASPGWYAHLWQASDRTSILWVTRAARLLREQDLDASSASVIEAVRMADALAALRDLPMRGLADLNEAIQTVLCHGDPAPMAVIRERLEIDERLGEVPDETPTVPLQADLIAQQRTLRLKPSPELRDLDLDLRQDTALARSHLLHRLSLLGIPWGLPQQVFGKAGTFHELWQIQWHPEFAVKLIEANVWGNTVDGAATAAVRHLAREARELPTLTSLLDAAILAALPGAIDYVLGCLGAVAAVAADLRHLMDALPPLARVARYGDVRQTRAAHILPMIDGLFERIAVGLPGACAALDDDSARAMVESIAHVQDSITLLDHDGWRAEWHVVLRTLIGRDAVHGLVRGWCCRLLLEAHVLDDADLLRLARLALSTVNPSPHAGAWVEGILRGSGLLLLQQDSLWVALDHWLSDLDSEAFIATLPLLRRAFSGFQPPERRIMAEKVARLDHAVPGLGATASDDGHALDHNRAALILPILEQILSTGERNGVPPCV